MRSSEFRITRFQFARERVIGDSQADMKVLGETAITKQWPPLTDLCQAPLKTAAPGEWRRMTPEIYHLD